MSERDKPCDWCIGRPEPDNGEIGCLLCGDTRMVGYSIGDLPYRCPDKREKQPGHSKYALEKAIEAIEGKRK